MANVLFLDANWDVITQYCFVFRRALVIGPLDKDASHTVRQVTGPQMLQPEVDVIVREHDFQYISGAGHGHYSKFLGYGNKEIWNAGNDLTHLSGKIIHLLSCNTGASLGRSMVTQGCRAFWGYTETFVFLHQEEDDAPQNLEDDESAGDALRMDCLIDQEILNGSSASVVYKSVQDYVRSICPNLPTYRRYAVISNYRHLVCPMTIWGDPKATIDGTD